MSEKESLMRRTNAAVEAYKSPRVRWVTGRSQIKVEIDEQRYKEAVDKIIQEEIERAMITNAIKEKGPLTVEELTQLTDLQPSRIMEHIIVLRKKGVVGEGEEKNRQYLYQLL